MATSDVERRVAGLSDEQAMQLDGWLRLVSGYEPDPSPGSPWDRDTEIARRQRAVAEWDREGVFTADWYGSLSNEDVDQMLVQLGDMLESRGVEFEFTDEQWAEIERRLDKLEDDLANGRPIGTPWEEVRAQLFGHLGE
jgi:putative addiction module component (TIGR02574 family)